MCCRTQTLKTLKTELQTENTELQSENQQLNDLNKRLIDDSTILGKSLRKKKSSMIKLIY